MLRQRHWSTGALPDLRDAIDAFRQAIDATPPGSPLLARCLAGLGSALVVRHRFTSGPEDLEEAIALLQRAVASLPDPSRELPELLGELGDALLARHIDSGSPEDLDAALDAYERAVATTPPGSLVMPRRRHELGRARMARHARSQNPDDLEAALTELRLAVDATPDGSPQKVLMLLALGVALTVRHRESQNAEDERAAVAALRAGTLAGRDAVSDAALQAASFWGGWASERAAWAEAAEAYAIGLEVTEHLVRGEASRSDKEVWLSAASDLPAPAAYALARAGDVESAVLALERGRALLLTEALEGGEDPEALLAPMTFADVAEVAEVQPLAYVAAADAGGVALVVDQRAGVEVVWLDELGAEAVSKRAWAYLGAKGGAGRRTAVDEVTDWLWDALMAPLLAAAPPGRPLVLVPVGLLGLLPLHAAWRHDASTPSGRRYALDERRLTYAANARVLARCRERANLAYTGSLLAVEDTATLRHAHEEVESAARHFAAVRRLGGDRLAAAEVLAALPEHAVLHFACHGAADPVDPAASRLVLSPTESLTLREVIAQRLRATRLAVLSACETAVPGAQLPDEALGLPAGFIEAGAAGVVGSLWEVPDLSTMLLMGRFYERWRAEELEPAEALRQAQQWLRDGSNAEKRAHFPGVADLSGDGVAAWARADWEETSDQAAPYHWAAFTYVGA